MSGAGDQSGTGYWVRFLIFRRSTERGNLPRITSREPFPTVRLGGKENRAVCSVNKLIAGRNEDNRWRTR
jgi:hypothetical protein